MSNNRWIHQGVCVCVHVCKTVVIKEGQEFQEKLGAGHGDSWSRDKEG